MDECRDLLEEMGQTVQAIYANDVSHRLNNMIAPRHGIVIKTIVLNERGVKYSYCKRDGHLIHYYNALKVRVRRHGHNKWMKHIHLQHREYVSGHETIRCRHLRVRRNDVAQ